MTISEFIKELEELKNIHGDIPVVARDNYNDIDVAYADIYLKIYKNTPIKTLIISG